MLVILDYRMHDYFIVKSSMAKKKEKVGKVQFKVELAKETFFVYAEKK